jgi:superoxide reductase
MTKLNEIYKCEICGNIVNILHTGAGELVCCNQPMNLITEKTKDEGLEKHIPVIEKLTQNICKGGDGVLVKIGEIEHPMEEKHYIEWIEITTIDNKIGKKFLNPSDKPEAEFHSRSKIKEIRSYCNIHGLWKVSL